jgi:ABC-2 type transport system ATP-binding protein
VIHVAGLSKDYLVHEKEAGFMGSVRAFFKRKTKAVKAVNDISFEIEAGEIVGFLGSNGAGKTTTLKMLSGLLHPSRGEVRVAGFEPKRRQKAFLKTITLVMGQKQQLTWDLAAVDSFLVNQAIYEIPDEVYKQRLGELTEMLSLEGMLNKQVRKLSLGERMKCELAAALLHQPKVLFLDEPTIGLDVNMQGSVREFIANYNTRYGATVMLTSHYMADVTALAKRIMVIDKGELIFDGDLQRLIEERAPEKILKLQFDSPQHSSRLEFYGKVRSCNDLQAELLVSRRDITRVSAKLLNDLPVADISIEEIPIEEIIGQVFKQREEVKSH